jgi:hypothetical protein
MAKKSKRATVFAVCLNNAGYPVSLEAGKLYEVIPDAEAEKHGLIRVIDESGEDYGYSAERFFVLDVPHALEKALKGISAARQPNPTLKPTSGAHSAKAKRIGTPRRSRLSV